MDLPAGVQYFLACERNKVAIAEALHQHWHNARRVLEFATGTGQQIAHFAQLHPSAHFQPSDQNEQGALSIAHWTRACTNVAPLLVVDLIADPSTWHFDRHAFDVAYVVNLLHISDRGTTVGLFRAAQMALRPGGRLCIYGPFKKNGAFTTDSNRAFDDKLRSMDPHHYGLRDMDELTHAGKQCGFTLTDVKDMPSNNFFITYTLSSTDSTTFSAL